MSMPSEGWGIRRAPSEVEAQEEGKLGQSQASRWRRGRHLGGGGTRAQRVLDTNTGFVFVVKTLEMGPEVADRCVDSVTRKYGDRQSLNAKEDIESIEAELTRWLDFHHPNIVQVLGYQISARCLQIHMEQMSGDSLAAFLATFGALAGPEWEPLFRRYARDMLCGLAYLHGQADVWAVGCLLIEMATAEAPWGPRAAVDEVMCGLLGAGEVCAPAIPHDLFDDGRHAASWCLRLTPSSRPTPTELLGHALCAQRSGAPAPRTGREGG